MKKSSTLILFTFLLVANNLFSQACNKQLNPFQFQQQMQQLRAISNESILLSKSKGIAETHCLTSLQVKEMASLFISDLLRLEFAISAYAQTLDKQNFYTVYDAFAYFSSVFQLHDFITTTCNNKAPTQVPTFTFNFPPLTYPMFQQYAGAKNCPFPLSDADFHQIASQVFSQQTDINKMAVATNLCLGNCMATVHIMKIATFLQDGNMRLQFVKSAYDRVYDVQNYGAASQVFPIVQQQQEFLHFLQTKQSLPVEIPAPDLPSPCPVSAEEFHEILNAIKKESFSNTRLTLAKTIAKSKNCLLATQIKEMTALLDFENARLEFATFAYDYCFDRENYFIVADALSYTSSKNELMKTINSRK